MRWAIMSDAHANPKALKLALDDAVERKCERFLFLGDVTGYGYDANAALEIVRSRFDVVLMGNHDCVSAGLDETRIVTENPNYDVDRQQGKKLSAAEIAWLRTLPYIYRNEFFSAVHAAFQQSHRWPYILEMTDAEFTFATTTDQLMFCGHTHHATIWEQDEDENINVLFSNSIFHFLAKSDSITFEIEENSRYIVNCGSVGYPRSDCGGTYVIFDSEVPSIELRRLPFDFSAYRKELQNAGIAVPKWLERRLRN